jgi:hypothetical protein
VLKLELRFPDGARTAWREEVELGAESMVQALTLPLSAREASGLALLVAHVHLEGAGGDVRADHGLGGRFVEVADGQLTATERRFGAMMGVGLIDDPHDRLEIDEESDEIGEVVR